MTIGVHRAIRTPNALGADWPRHFLLETLRALSAHQGWNIIDSECLAASPPRVKGDPLVDDLWGGIDETALTSNSWFVAEQANPEPGFPAMQIKFQGTGSPAFDDVSGNDYDWEGTTRIMCVRFAPFGGWNLADSNPDFNNPTKVSKNFSIEGQYNVVSRWFWVIDDDFILMPQPQGIVWANVACYIGAYNPMKPEQHTPAHPCYMFFGNDSNGQFQEGYWTSNQSEWFLNDFEIYLRYTYVSCPDENGDMGRWYGLCPPLGYFFHQAMCPNEFDGDQTVDLIEVPISGRQIGSAADSPDTRHIGSHKHVWVGYGVGQGAYLGNREYRTLGGNQVCAIIPWDGNDYPF